ncbi:VOC family protein [Nocardioides sp. YIM 152315]|uniref:VOC family protein n=1 Tax=Nocardioides sp. YIM 152315 TaxID=3031760 RepID=UPI0023DB7977|nr:VOC family protein [Nocardioides sp. YIM 152315]MDF1604672.1 VOC family protein [Nocardioides sp. YIM 152315]
MTHLRGLGYLRVQTQDVTRWRELTVECLGLVETTGPVDDGLYLRMDEREARLIVLPGDVDKVLAVGWEVRDQFGLAAVARTVEAAGVAVKELTAAECADLRIEAGVRFDDPAGTPVEVFYAPVLDHDPVRTKWTQRFVTGDQGMGHVVLPTTAFEDSYTFYSEVLGFLPRGAMRVGPPDPAAPPRRVRFLGINERHHSLALCPAPHGEAPGLVHLMVEVDSLDAVGRALDEIGSRGFSISSTLGRHTNDKMVSFYVRAPGGWDIEYGYDGMHVDETYYTAEEITRDSYWGHDWSGSEPLAAFVPPAD